MPGQEGDFRFAGVVDHIAVESEDLRRDVREYERLGFRLETLYDDWAMLRDGRGFGVALLASGIASSCVGTMSGQVVMQGFLQRQIPVFARRAITMVPALIVIGIGFDPSKALVLSQVFLSFGIPFALIPLLIFTSRRTLMGSLVNRKPVVAAATVVTTLIVGLNGYLLVSA